MNSVHILCKDLPVVGVLRDLCVKDWVLLPSAMDIMEVETEAAVRAQVRKGRIRARRLNNGLVFHLGDLIEYTKRRKAGEFRKGGRPRKTE